MKKILLIDGNSLFFKSFYATYFQLKENMPGSRSKNNEPINALRTFATLMMNLKDSHKDFNILVAFDERDSETFRHQHSFYKATRDVQPQELYQQIPFIKEFLDLYGIKYVSNKYLEADDIIGILAHKYKKDSQIKIISTDKDLLQLVDANVDVYLSKSGVSIMEEYNILNFSDKFLGLKPNQIPDLKGIMGDTSDNLKGIAGIGEAGAVKLLKQFGSLESVFENLSQLTPSMQKKISEGKEMGILSKQLATIISENEFDVDWNEIQNLSTKYLELEEFLTNKSVFNLLKRLK